MKNSNNFNASKITILLLFLFTSLTVLIGQNGYLKKDQLPDSKAILPPSPDTIGPIFALDLELAINVFPKADAERKAQAVQDASNDFSVNQPFKEIIGFEISQDSTPILYQLILRSILDANASTDQAKNAYQRVRPFVYLGIHDEKPDDTCTPLDEGYLRDNGSYPSGHAAMGWIYALIMTEIFPDLSAELLARGIDFGTSRNICNAHWYSDVLAGRLMGAATLAVLHNDLSWKKDFVRARAEALQMRK